jgi:hypothetical protein
VTDASTLLGDLQASAFRDIAGSRVSARIPVSRALLNRLVAAALDGKGAPVRGVDVQPRAGDQFDVVITVSWTFVPPLKAAFSVDQQPSFPALPVLVLRWSFLGAVGGLAARLITLLDRLPAGVRLDKDRLVLDIAVLAARSSAAALLPYVRALELHTLDDRAVIDLELEVPQPG